MKTPTIHDMILVENESASSKITKILFIQFNNIEYKIRFYKYKINKKNKFKKILRKGANGSFYLRKVLTF